MPEGVEGEDLLDDSLPTAKTLSSRAVLDEPHAGHFTLVSAVMERCSCSKRASHDLH
jgi:hypothetical protein